MVIFLFAAYWVKSADMMEKISARSREFAAVRYAKGFDLFGIYLEQNDKNSVSLRLISLHKCFYGGKIAFSKNFFFGDCFLTFY